MVELKDKTVEELRKMASKKKIEGRSKMNKAELVSSLERTKNSKGVVRALKKKTSTKKMKGGIGERVFSYLSNKYAIYSLNDCHQVLPAISGYNSEQLNKIKWSYLPKIPIKIGDDLEEIFENVPIDISESLTDENKKKKCRLYLNKCKFYNFLRYFNMLRNHTYNTEDLTQLLKNTIPFERDENIIDFQNFLIMIGANLTVIDNEEFMGKSISNISIPNSVTTIGDNAFSNNLLTSLIIPDSVINIGFGAFSNNHLTSITIPDSVTFIGGSAFFNNLLTSVSIPNSLRDIPFYAFSNNKLTSISIPDSVEFIWNFAFINNHLTSVTLPNSVKLIGIRAFSNNLLTEVTIPNSVTAITSYAFSDNKLTSILIPDSVTAIWESAFSNNQITQVTIPNSVTNIRESAFSNNQITQVTIPDSVKTIGSRAFFNNKLTSLTVPNSIEDIGNNSFSGNPLTSVSIPRRFLPYKNNIFGHHLNSIHFTYTNENRTYSNNNIPSSNLININATNNATGNNPLKFNDGDCPICWGNTNKNNPLGNRKKLLTKLKPCGHIFHKDCIRQWINTTRNRSSNGKIECPSCRKKFTPPPN